MLASFLAVTSLLAIGVVNAAAAPPTAITEAPVPAKTSATFKGSVNPNGITTTYYWEWGLTTAYGTKSSEFPAGSGSSLIKESGGPAPLAEATVYHVRFVAKNKDGTSFGEDVAFKTLEYIPTWALQTTPKLAETHQMNDVSCVTGGECIAVGDTATGTLATRAMRWNGTEWAFQTTAVVTGPKSLSSVSCTSASSCMAVGYFTVSGSKKLLAERWDGKEWKTQGTGLSEVTGEFKGVSCASASECIAVGSAGVWRWNGTEWGKIETSTVYKDVSCLTASFCMAVGSSGSTMTWNGTKWTPRTGLSGYVLEGVSCTAENACTAIGTVSLTSGVVAAGRWNGSEWKTQPISAPAGSIFAELYSVSCPNSSVCVATGTYVTEGGAVIKTLAERWNGVAWEVQSSPNQAGAKYGLLSGVSCISAAICESVGRYESEKGELLTLAERAS